MPARQMRVGARARGQSDGSFARTPFAVSRWPIHSSFCRSWNPADRRLGPLTSNHSPFLCPAQTWPNRKTALRTIVEPHQDGREIFAVDANRLRGPLHRSSRRPRWTPTVSAGCRPTVVNIGEHLNDAPADDVAARDRTSAIRYRRSRSSRRLCRARAATRSRSPGAASPAGRRRERSARGRARRRRIISRACCTSGLPR